MTIDASNRVLSATPATPVDAAEPLAGLSVEDAVAVLQSRARDLETEIQKHAVALDRATITHDLDQKLDGILAGKSDPFFGLFTKRHLDANDVNAARGAYDTAIAEARQSADWDLVTKLTRAKETFDGVVAKKGHFEAKEGTPLVRQFFETTAEKAADPDFSLDVELDDGDVEAIKGAIDGPREDPKTTLQNLLGLLAEHRSLVEESKDWLRQAMDRLG